MSLFLVETEKVEKERAQSAERIQSLHSRLHQEAEKIRKWKTSTEIELKEKVMIVVSLKVINLHHKNAMRGKMAHPFPFSLIFSVH